MRENTTIVIFGASGDLTSRKLIPALLNLYCKQRLPNNTRIVGFARRPWDDDTFRQKLRDSAAQFMGQDFEADLWPSFASNIHYMPGSIYEPDDFRKLHRLLVRLEQGPSNRLYYLSVGPTLYEPAIKHLAAAEMTAETDGWRRVVVEKPFGHDLASARELNQVVHSAFSEQQVYRIDHYLGKETAQNILFFRFANTIFEPVWNRRYVDHVQISVTETVDVGHRAGYYDQSGVVRDMFQNHLLQLLSLVAMEAPASFEADAVRNEKAKVLSAVRPVEPQDTVRAQYVGYREAEGVAPGSETPTYAALKLYIDNWRWQGVPFYLRSGKALKQKSSEIIIRFQRPPHVMFDLPPGQELIPNILALCIQPDEGVHLKFQAKVPDSAQEMRPVDMEFHYRSGFGVSTLPDAYERLLLDALQGDASLFARSDEIELAWKIIDPILAGWEASGQPPLAFYQPGTWGPAEADAFVARDGRQWWQGCSEHD
ncbi:MAG: glucose-6-phosphate dehydrogenase [Anaerolineae bacterium]